MKQPATPRTAPRRWTAVIAPALILLAGIPLGVAWWLLAPSGLNLLSGDPGLASGMNTTGWLPRDLVLAGLLLLGGCMTGVLISGKDGPTVRNIVIAVLCGAVASVIAWRVGILAAEWWGTAEDASANPSIAFSLRAYPVLLVWPAATALSVFVVNLVSLMRRPAEIAD
ncbi:hypothetical protein M1D88_10505 [Arthrobacter sp. R1-13]